MKSHDKILIIRLSAIGDVVFASPLIKALRLTYPKAHISWLVEPAAASLLKNNTDLDKVIILPRVHWKQLWHEHRFLQLFREIKDFTVMLRSQGFDMALDLQGLLKSGVWTYFSGAKIRMGLGSKELSKYFMTQIVSPASDDPRIGSEYLKMAKTLDLNSGEFLMDIALSEEDNAYVAGLNIAGRYAVICPFTTRPQKHWVEDRWAVLAQEIMDQCGFQVLMLGGPGDIEAGSRIHSANNKIINLVGKSSITQSASVIKHSSLLVGVDTGLTHMGIAFNVPTLALFGSTCPYTDTTRDNARVLIHKMDCSPCRRNPTCNGEFTCMKYITVEEVMSNVKEVIV
jgi:heptosyltransferase I